MYKSHTIQAYKFDPLNSIPKVHINSSTAVDNHEIRIGFISRQHLANYKIFYKTCSFVIQCSCDIARIIVSPINISIGVTGHVTSRGEPNMGGGPDREKWRRWWNVENWAAQE